MGFVRPTSDVCSARTHGYIPTRFRASLPQAAVVRTRGARAGGELSPRPPRTHRASRSRRHPHSRAARPVPAAPTPVRPHGPTITGCRFPSTVHATRARQRPHSTHQPEPTTPRTPGQSIDRRSAAWRARAPTHPMTQVQPRLTAHRAANPHAPADTYAHPGGCSLFPVPSRARGRQAAVITPDASMPLVLQRESLAPAPRATVRPTDPEPDSQDSRKRPDHRRRATSISNRGVSAPSPT